MQNRPPDIDLDALIQKFVNKLRSHGGKFASKGISFFLFIIVLLWLASGIYFVAPDEKGVVLRFGQALYATDPGPHWRIPWPIESVYKPKVTQIKKIEIGFETVQVGPPARYREVPEESLMLTGDENIVDLEFIVQYKIKDPIKYLFKIRRPEKALKDAAEATMRQIVGRQDIDAALTTGKGMIQNEALTMLQEILDTYESGLHVVNIKLQDVQPPQQVNDAFKDVINAQQDRERMINEAKGYSNDIIPKARGLAARKVNEAEAYKETLIKNAEGETERFLSVYKEYKIAKQVTRKRLYLETMEKILPGMNKIILDEEAQKKVLPYLPIDNLNRKPKTSKGGN